MKHNVSAVSKTKHPLSTYYAMLCKIRRGITIPSKETIILLESDGFILARHGANHDIYFSPTKRITIPVKRHDFDEGDKRYILKEAKIYYRGKQKDKK